MNENVATPLNPVTSLQIRCTRKIRGFAGGYGEIISRGLRVVSCMMMYLDGYIILSFTSSFFHS